ncbi:MAG: RNA 3'-terminal phosphate cyclase, partial [Candidatus Nanoarchaeia archaeon]|nr:RNA 3'-terminal phosphate cyclase [Candidatus Nanoarchaeia archaeon]
GGQIIRSAVSLSALTGKPVTISNIRANRAPPGLKAQHLTGITALADICGARLSGAEVGSTKIIFEPGKIKSGTYNWDIGTAGAITLVLQALMPAVLFSKKDFVFRITGGTAVTHSPPIEYFQHVFCDYLKRFGADISVEIERYGFYPKGGGQVTVKTRASELSPVEILERGKLVETNVWSIASSDLQKASVAERQIKGFKKEFGETKYGKLDKSYVGALSTGSVIHAHNVYENCIIGAEELGERGKPAEKVGEECAQKLKKEIQFDSTLDEHMLDQIIPYMALLGGKFRFRQMTSHAETNIWVTEQFLPVKFEVKGNVIWCKKL